MPIGFLTAAERDRLNRFPTLIPDEDLRAFFLVSDADQMAIHHQREDHTRLGFALQLCTLRYLGFAPHDLHTTPWAKHYPHLLMWGGTWYPEGNR